MAQVSFSMLVEAARSGTHLISFPTDTVPALASRPDRSHLIFEAKQRSTTKPLILMGARAEDLWPYVKGTEAEKQVWQDVTNRHWPGALTLVLPASDRIPVEMNPHDPTTLGIRVPNSAIARTVLTHTGPLATTSVNRSGEAPLLTVEAINESFPEVLTLSPDEIEQLGRSPTIPSIPPDHASATPLTAPLPSTVVQWTGSGWKIIRQGTVHL